MKKRVVITGVGPVTSSGIGKDLFFENIMNMGGVAKKIPDSFSKRYDYRSKYYVPFPGFEFKDYGISTQFNSIMQNEDRLAILGTKLALEDAGIEIEKTDSSFKIEGSENASVILGIGMSSLDSAFSSYLAHIGVKHPDSKDEKSNHFNRMIIPMMMSNSPVAWTSIFFQLQGASHSVNASCASGTIAIGEAYRQISEGRTDLAITGGVESLVDKDGATMRGFDTIGALTTANDGISRPFSKNRSGFLFAEGGGAVLVLEEMEQAVKRGARIYAEIVDYAENCDAFNIVKLDNDGDQISKILKQLSVNRKIDYLNAHGTGTLLNDETESLAIKRIFGKKENQPFINSTKGIMGHTIGGSGAIETVVTALAISNSRIHGNYTDQEMEDINYTEKSVETNVKEAITVSFGFGGHNAGLLLKEFRQ
ncbi:MAG: beta-ketoacyl-[acyl-carrier-protein] synthase family protein [Desulfobacterales bacterium]|nr:beta-ketoacyl-[acyl-carrier-protein] synthase family protein [Desulfobacterales bacterium]MCP4161847.1 beta-ketoacyl-[acyl-carrier-protein] synthase family protein [Deltaproteobacteria bacterium]